MREIMTSSAANRRLDASCQKPVILIVEDEVLVRIVMSEELRAAGYDVVEAATADEALSILRSMVHVDLLLTDMTMPGALGGDDLVALVRANFPLVKIVMVSGQQPKKKIRDVLDGFLLKPAVPTEVISCLRTLVAPVTAP